MLTKIHADALVVLLGGPLRWYRVPRGIDDFLLSDLLANGFLEADGYGEDTTWRLTERGRQAAMLFRARALARAAELLAEVAALDEHLDVERGGLRILLDGARYAVTKAQEKAPPSAGVLGGASPDSPGMGPQERS